MREFFSHQSQMPLQASEVFNWHTRVGAFERLSPPWVNMEVLERTGGIEDGGRVVLLLRQTPVEIKWTLAHKDFVAGRQFKDYQISGPFEFWEQVHACEPIEKDSSFLKDSVQFELPFSMFSHAVGVPMIRHELRRLFRYRHRLMQKDCDSLLKYGSKPKRIAITGSTGLVGRHLIPFLWTQNSQVMRLVRPQSSKEAVVQVTPGPEPTAVWDPAAGTIDESALENLDAVIHLSGENIAQGRWTEEKKERLRQSRMASTRLLVETCAKLKNPPPVFICASAIGFYGNCGDEVLDESSPIGKGFLAHLCEEWEALTKPLTSIGVRVVNLRLGIVLSPKGGALGAMLPAFSVGAGGPLGAGRQYLSWISPDDVAGAIYHCLCTESLSGPVNITAPNPVPNKDFADVLGHILFRPALLPMPAQIVRMLFGEFGDEGLLGSTRVMPKKLLESGYVFREPDLETALKCQLGAV